MPPHDKNGEETTEIEYYEYPAEDLQQYLDMGYTLHGLSTAAGLDSHTLYAGSRSGVLTAEQIDAVIAMDPEECLHQPVWRAVRRIRALLMIGFRLTDIADGAGITLGSLRSYSAPGRKYIDVENFRRLSAFYDEHKDDEPRPVASRKILRNGWAPPSGWIDIDDPHETPTLPEVDEDRCINGHPWEGNTLWSPDKTGKKYRVCRICHRAAVARYEARKKARAVAS